MDLDNAAPEAQNTGEPERITVQTTQDFNPAPEPNPPIEDAFSGEGDDPNDPDQSDPSADDKGKPPRGVQKRLDELTREKYEARRAHESAQAQLDQALKVIERLSGGAPSGSPEAPQIDPSAAPDPANYRDGEFDPQFMRDVARYEARQELMAEREAMQRQETVRQIKGREDAARSRYEDYDQVVHDRTLAPIAQYNPMILPMLAEHELGPDIAYHLGKNPEEVINLARLHPMQAAIRLGQLAMMVQPQDNGQPPKQEKAPPRKAPPPITPVKAGGTAPAASLDEQLAALEAKGDFDGWRALKRAHKG